MAETKKVELLREIKHGANGKVFKYSPAPKGVTKHTLIPISLYNTLKDTYPPHFRDAVDVVIETIGAEVETTPLTPVQGDIKTGDEKKITPVQDIVYDDPSELEDSNPAPLAEEASVAEVQAEALTKIVGVGPALARNLVEAGFVTVVDVALATADSLDDLSGIHEGNVDGIIASANELVA